MGALRAVAAAAAAAVVDVGAAFTPLMLVLLLVPLRRLRPPPLPPLPPLPPVMPRVWAKGEVLQSFITTTCARLRCDAFSVGLSTACISRSMSRARAEGSVCPLKRCTGTPFRSMRNSSKLSLTKMPCGESALSALRRKRKTGQPPAPFTRTWVVSQGCVAGLVWFGVGLVWRVQTGKRVR